MSISEAPVLFFEYALLIWALRITVTNSVDRVIRMYRIQCVLLAFAVALTARAKLNIPGAEGVAISVQLALILVLPAVLAIYVGKLLRRATAYGTPVRHRTAGERVDAYQVWRDATEQGVSHRVLDVVAFVAVAILAAVIALQFGFEKPGETLGLTVSLTLHLIGLYMIAYKRDLISQTVGLLVMDHGLYLAVVRVVDLPAPGLLFVVGLWFYTAITLFILLYLVPQVRLQVSRGIDLDGIASRSELKG
jgi:hydrogenase-4 membrane subunit HyfE